MTGPIACRRAGPDDLAFVWRSWLGNWRNADESGVLPHDLFFSAHRQAFSLLLERPGVEVWVACNPYEEDARHELYGFLVLERSPDVPVIHFVYTKHAFRRARAGKLFPRGVAESLFLAAGVNAQHRFIASFKTPDARALVGAKHLNVKFDPWRARGPKKEAE